MSFDPSKPQLSGDVVENIFSTLTMVYGKDFSARWRDVDMARVKTNWAERLAWCTPQQIEWALANLPERAPNVVQFEALCMNAPASSAAAEDFAEDAPPPTAEQRARIHALCAQAFGNMGCTQQAERSAAAAAVALEEARDEAQAQGRSTVHLATLLEDAAREVEQARERRIAEVMEPFAALHPDGKPWQFDLEALLRRASTPQEQPRDWARIIAARVERGGQMGDFARNKAREALKGIEPEGWTVRRAAPAQRALAPQPAPPQAAAPAPVAPAEVEFDPWAEEVLPV